MPIGEYLSTVEKLAKMSIGKGLKFKGKNLNRNDRKFVLNRNRNLDKIMARFRNSDWFAIGEMMSECCYCTVLDLYTE